MCRFRPKLRPPRNLQGPPRRLPAPSQDPPKSLPASQEPLLLQGPIGAFRTLPQNFQGTAHVVGSHALLKGLPSPFQGLHLLSPVKGPLLAHRAFQSKIHKFREPRDFTNFGSQLTLSTVVILPTPPCKAEKLRLRQRAAARYPCVRASPKIQFNRHRVSERAAPSRERPTPSWPSRSLLVQDASSSGASKSIYLRKYRNE